MIRAVDTNVIARWMMRDEPQQAAQADRIMNGPIEVTHTVLLELGWVMTSVGRMTREQFADTALTILSIEQAVIESRDKLRWAIERYRAGADWADMVHLASTGTASIFTTFDKDLAKRAGAGAVLRIEALS